MKSSCPPTTGKFDPRQSREVGASRTGQDESRPGATLEEFDDAWQEISHAVRGMEENDEIQLHGGRNVRVVELAEVLHEDSAADNGHSQYTGREKLVAAVHMPGGPYRGHKGDVWEGGHRVGLVIRWPGRIEAGKRNDQLISLTDLFATCAQSAPGNWSSTRALQNSSSRAASPPSPNCMPSQ